MINVGDIVNIKEEYYKGAYSNRWFSDSRFGLKVLEKTTSSSICMRADRRASYHISLDRLELAVEKEVEITLNKTYRTRAGSKVKLYAIHTCNRKEDDEEVHGAIYNAELDIWEASEWFLNGKWYGDEEEDNDLFEVETTPNDWKRNKPMMCRIKKGQGIWYRRHFAKLSSDGKPLFYTYGKTSFSGRVSYDNSRETTRTYGEYREPTSKEMK